MFVQSTRILGCARWLTGLGALVIIGCGNDGGSLSTLGSSVIQTASENPYYESQSNDFLQTAELVDLDDQLRAIQGTITGPGDVDTYNLGPVQVGDRIVVEASTEPGLNGAVALFDETGAALLVNDHRNVYLGRSDPFIDVVISRASAACYVAMSATPGYRADDDYTMLAYKEPSQELLEPRPDVILLIFDGGHNVRIGNRPSVDVPVFDAANIDPVYAGRTSTMIDHIVAGVREDFTGLDITILSTSEGAVYEGDMSRVFFGTYDAALLGVAENVDEFNSTQRQEAIIFTDTFAAFMTLDPSVAEMGQAIANVAAHETGHLMGLVHTNDPAGIMDVTAGLRDLLTNQSFRKSPLYRDVFPLGSQDGIQSLLDACGGNPVVAFMKYLDNESTQRDRSTEAGEPPARESLCFSGCGCGVYDPE